MLFSNSGSRCQALHADPCRPTVLSAGRPSGTCRSPLFWLQADAVGRDPCPRLLTAWRGLEAPEVWIFLAPAYAGGVEFAGRLIDWILDNDLEQGSLR